MPQVGDASVFSGLCLCSSCTGAQSRHWTAHLHQQQLSCPALQPAQPVRHLSAHAAATSGTSPAYPYHSGDGRSQKATLEHIFQPDHGEVDMQAAASSSVSTSGNLQAPWSVGWQVNERNIMWSDDLKMRLIKVSCWRSLGSIMLTATTPPAVASTRPGAAFQSLSQQRCSGTSAVCRHLSKPSRRSQNMW
jgi:hypothetical protein